ncbi:MAG: TPM domain-containing protein [Chitinophagales bacterium]|nr:TPM domain-containing protein [Chitinophagales bacterium]
MSSATSLLNQSQQEQIVKAIQKAERGTSGEIRVHLEDHTSKDALLRAEEVFLKLKMQKTKLRTGALIYAAVKDRKLAIIGDKGIHDVVGSDFWEKERDLLVEYFSKGNYAEGLVKVIGLIGEQLQQFFPQQPGDKNELPNEVSFK